MRTLALGMVFALVALGTSLAYLAFLPHSGDALVLHWRAVIASIPSAERRAAMAESSTRIADQVQGSLAWHPVAGSFDSRPAVALSIARAEAAKAALPVAFGLFYLGVVGGLLRRHLRAENLGFHSVTFSHMGKLLVLAGVVGYVVSGIAPVGLPIASLYVFSAAVAVGATLYVGNLPPRL